MAAPRGLCYDGHSDRPPTTSMSQQPALDRLLADLRHPEAATKKRAILEILKSELHDALFALQEVSLHDEDVEIRYFASKAANFLRAMKPAAPAAEAPQAPIAGVLTLETAARDLRAPEPDTRLRCLQLIVHARDSRYLFLLFEITDGETEPLVRSALPLAIGILGNKDHVPFIVQKFLKDANARVRANAIEALERIGDVSAYPYIIGFLQDKDNRVRTNAALALNKFGKVNLIRTLEAMLFHPRVWMRDSAAYALQVIKIPEVVPLLERAMEDPYEGIRIKAKKALEGLAAKGVAAASVVLARFPDVKEEETLDDFLRLAEMEVSQADEAAADAEAAAAVQEMAEAVPEPADSLPPPPPRATYDFASGDRARRVAEVQRAVAAQDRGVTAQLRDLAGREPDEHVRATLAVALGHLSDTEGLEVLIKLLEDKDARVRANAVEALGKLRHDRGFAQTLKFLKDQNARVVANAIWALRNYPHVDVYPALDQMVVHRKDEFRKSAIWLIGQLKTYNAIKHLEKLVTDRVPDVKERAVTLLKRLRDEGNSVARTSCVKLRIKG